MELWRGDSQIWVVAWIVGHVCPVSIERRREGAAEGEPEASYALDQSTDSGKRGTLASSDAQENWTGGISVLTKGTEDNEGKSVAQEELKDPSKAHEEASDEVVRRNGGDAIAACTSPTHELTGQRTQAEQEAEESESNT